MEDNEMIKGLKKEFKEFKHSRELKDTVAKVFEDTGYIFKIEGVKEENGEGSFVRCFITGEDEGTSMSKFYDAKIFWYLISTVLRAFSGLDESRGAELIAAYGGIGGYVVNFMESTYSFSVSIGVFEG